MPHSRSWTRRLLNRLTFPDDADKMLDDPKYWDSAICSRYFDQVDRVIFDNPRAGLRMAEVAPRLAQLVPEEHGQAGRLRHRSRLVRAYALLGGAYRAAGDPGTANRIYDIALGLVESEEVAESEKANLYMRLSTLRTCQKQHEEARNYADRAERIFRELSDSESLAMALVSKGYALIRNRQPAPALECFGEALVLVPNPNASPRVTQIYHAASHNLSSCSLLGQPEDLTKARQYIRQARRCIKGRQSVPKAKLRWIEGRILIRLGSTKRGETFLQQALEDLEAIGAGFEAALVALELSILWRREGRWRDLRDLATATYRRFRDLSGGDSEAIAALSLWLDAVTAHKVTVELIRETQAIIETRLAPGSCCNTTDP